MPPSLNSLHCGAALGICTSVILPGACEGECWARLHGQAQIQVFLWLELLGIHSGEVQGSPGVFWYIWRVVLLQVEFRGGFVQLRKEESLRRCDNIQGDILCPRGQKGKSSACCVSRPASLCLSVYLWEQSEFPGC